MWNGVDRSIDHGKVKTRDSLKSEIKKSCQTIDLNFYFEKRLMIFEEYSEGQKCLPNKHFYYYIMKVFVLKYASLFKSWDVAVLCIRYFDPSVESIQGIGRMY